MSRRRVSEQQEKNRKFDSLLQLVNERERVNQFVFGVIQEREYEGCDMRQMRFFKTIKNTIDYLLENQSEFGWFNAFVITESGEQVTLDIDVLERYG
jgi:hypothetical protein